MKNKLDRRAFLGLGGALALESAMAQQPGPTGHISPPPPPKTLPEFWTRSPRIAVWPNSPPDANTFAPQPVPPDTPPVFLRNIQNPDLHVFRPANPNGHALLVLPGGAYWFVSAANEGADVAQRMTALGITVFVLTYRLPGEGWKNRSSVPLQDAQRSMRVIRANAAQYNVDPRKVSVLGFSAGGHLAATLATAHAEHTYESVDATDTLDPRPFSAGLIYPVATMQKEWTHEMSRKLLLGDSPSEAEIEHRSAERQVTPTTPPTFLAHAFDDEAVPVENSLRFMNAMRTARRPVEAHLFQEGGHAFGVGIPNTPSAQWPSLYWAWLQRLR